MRSALLWISLVGFFSVVTAKLDFLSGLSDEDFKKLQEVVKYLQIRVGGPESYTLTGDAIAEPESQSSINEFKPPFEYNLPTADPNDGTEPFAVGPSDPRYYQDFPTPIDSTNSPTDSLEESKRKRPNTEIPEESLESFGEDLQSDVPDMSEQHVTIVPLHGSEELDIGIMILGIVGSILGLIAVVTLIFGCYRLQKNAKAAADVDYPAYGITGPVKEISPMSGDRRLAQSAQMYHYQHQKQQIIAMESMGNKERRSSVSDAESEEENEEGDYTVFECQGLAPTDEMEVRNPLFQDDQTPASKPTDDSTEEPRDHPNLISFD